jgi:general secretion pathway protein I
MPKPSSPPKPSLPAAVTGGRRRAAGGFTLLEVVLAFSILAIGMTIAMQIASTAMRQAQQAAEHTRAALYAQNLLDAAGLDEPLEPGEDSGEFDSGYRWQLSVQPFEAESEGLPTLLAGMNAPVELLELVLTVEWQRGNERQEAQFRTLRAVLPDMGR